jgi:zinc protease
MVLVIVGDVDTERVVSEVTEMFTVWQNKPSDRTSLPVVSRLDKRLSKSVTLEDKVQSNIVMGWPGPERHHPDFLPCFLANTVLGVFGMYGRLGKRIREENSLAYYAYSSISGGLGPGPWRIYTGVDPENIDDVITIIEDEIEHLVTEPIPDHELTDSKAFLTGSLPLHLETNEGLSQAIINIERHNLGFDYLRQYKQSIMQISPKNILNAVQNWMDPHNLALSIAGPVPNNGTSLLKSSDGSAA